MSDTSTNSTCPSTNTAAVDQEGFWSSGNVDWDAHRIGWAVAGSTALATFIISMTCIIFHARNFFVPAEQRQIIRILFMPPVYAIISFASYRYYRNFVYYELAEAAYESIALAAFLMLLIEYIGSNQDLVLNEVGKRKIPIPFCCIRFRPSKPYFMHALKWSVLQYVIIRPTLSIVGIIAEAYDVLCPEIYSPHYAEVYIEAIDFVSLTIALYGLITFYAVCKDRLKGRQPLSKFLSIKMIVAVVFYQGFIFSVLAKHGVLKPTQYWTASNIADGLSALALCCEMVLFSIWMGFAFNWREYRRLKDYPKHHTNPLRAILSAINITDFFHDMWVGVVFLYDYARGDPETHSATSTKYKGNFDFVGAVERSATVKRKDASAAGHERDYASGEGIVQQSEVGNGYYAPVRADVESARNSVEDPTRIAANRGGYQSGQPAYPTYGDSTGIQGPPRQQGQELTWPEGQQPTVVPPRPIQSYRPAGQ